MNTKEISKISNAIKNKDYIYVDCFDTLIRRKYGIKYCFFKIADFLVLDYGFPIDQEKLAESLFNIFSRCNVDFAVIVHDVYLHYDGFINVSFNIFYEDFKRIFLSSELDNIELCDNVLAFFELVKNKKLFLFSDYYLGKDDIASFFNKLIGYCPFDDIYISCDYHASKDNCSLYSLVDSPRKSLMIGDNYINDIINSNKVGIDSVFIDSSKNYLRYEILDNNYKKTIFKKMLFYIDKNKKTYVSNFAFSLFLFCKKLYSLLEQNDVICFLSRDGYFMKECFDLFLDCYPNNKNIKTKYLETSRLAMMLPAMEESELTPDNIKNRFVKRTQWRVSNDEEFLRYLGFEADEIKHLTPSLEKCNDYFSSEQYRKLFDNNEFINNLKKHRDSALERFRSLVSDSNKRFIIVDSGWQGTIQNDMRKVLNPDMDIIGYYLGTSRSIGEKEHSKKIGILFDYGNAPDNSILHYFAIEALLKTDQGQLISYSMSGDTKFIDNGNSVYAAYSKKCQEIALSIFKKLCELNIETPIPFSVLDEIDKYLYRKKSSLSYMYGLFYYNLQNSNEKHNRPKLRDYVRGIKAKYSIVHPSVYRCCKKMKSSKLISSVKVWPTK